MSRELEIMAAIRREREFQDKKYGKVLTPAGYLGSGDMLVEGCPMEQGPGGHELGAWLLILEKELEEAKKAVTHGGLKRSTGRNSIRSELVQIAAVAVAALEQHGLEE